MTTFTQKVLYIGWETKGSKKWRSIEVQDVKGGKTMKQHLFPDKSGDVIALVEKEGPGIYEIDKEKEGDFWTVKAARRVGNINGEPNGNGGHSPASGTSAPAAQSPHAIRAMVAGQCANAAATLVGALIQSGEFKGAGEDAILTYTKTVARVLRDDAREFINGKAQPKPEPKPEPAPEPEGV